MRTLHDIQALDAALAPARLGGRRIALVPTMGNLHAGHLALVAQARAAADVVVVSIFVNPLQFGPDEDYERYPRTLAADAAQLTAVGVDLLFAPDIAVMYPQGYPPATTIHVGGPLTETLEGAHRPGHFDGVATVVGILLNRVRPDVAVFGQKDWQQLAVIRRMAADLGLPVSLIGCPTARAADGLALSSRNQYLSPQERAAAPTLQAVLVEIGRALRDGRRDFAALCDAGEQRLRAAGFQPQYLAVCRLDLQPATAADHFVVVLAAAQLGSTRLIDNLPVPLAGDGAA